MPVRTIRIVLGMALLFGLTFLPALPAAADGTTSVRVVRYTSDGATVLQEQTIDVATMQSTLPVQGDGVTTYYHQGPSFDENNFWDPSETLNLKIKGALKGTDLKHLCALVGGMTAGDTVRVTAIDGFSKTFDSANVYTPSPRQGRIVVAWSSDSDGLVPGWQDGMMLAFFAETTNAAGQYVFGNEDMRQTLAENRWHYYDIYPSSNGFTIKNVAEIAVFSSAGGDDPRRVRAEVSLTATVVLSQVGISLSKSSIDYGEVEPGGVSPVVDVGITNTGNTAVSITLEVQGSNESAQSFYEQSLYINGAAYDRNALIASIAKSQSTSVNTQLKVPLEWDEGGRQDALLIFWAEAAD